MNRHFWIRLVSFSRVILVLSYTVWINYANLLEYHQSIHNFPWQSSFFTSFLLRLGQSSIRSRQFVWQISNSHEYLHPLGRRYSVVTNIQAQNTLNLLTYFLQQNMQFQYNVAPWNIYKIQYSNPTRNIPWTAYVISNIYACKSCQISTRNTIHLTDICVVLHSGIRSIYRQYIFAGEYLALYICLHESFKIWLYTKHDWFSVHKYIHLYFVNYNNFNFLDDEKIRLAHEI